MLIAQCGRWLLIFAIRFQTMGDLNQVWRWHQTGSSRRLAAARDRGAGRQIANDFKDWAGSEGRLRPPFFMVDFFGKSWYN